MIIDMKFWEHELRAAQTIHVNLHKRRELWHAFGKVSRPLTADIIRYRERQHNSANEGGQDNEVHICISVKLLAPDLANITTGRTSPLSEDLRGRFCELMYDAHKDIHPRQ